MFILRFAGATSYSILFYLINGFLALSICFVVTLDVRMDQSGQKTTEALRNIWTRPAILFFTLLTYFGIAWGILDTYSLAYLSQSQGASSQLISKKQAIHISLKINPYLPGIMLFLGGSSMVVMYVFVKRICNKIGDIHAIYIATLCISARLLAYGLVK